jgi:large subunit ribosomal protein L33
MAKKSGRIIVTLECTEAKAAGKSVSRYTTTKNKTKTPGRLEKKKYNPNMQKHTVHRETK